MYEKLYYTLFNAITTALEQMEEQSFQTAFHTLELAQYRTEELFADQGG